MKLSLSVLRRYIDLPHTPRELRELLDNIGLEIKRVNSAIFGNIEDTVFDIEILANRGDHYCYVGVAREISGRIGGGIRLPQTTQLDYIQLDEKNHLPSEFSSSIEVKTDLCLSYSATLLSLSDKETRHPLPADIRLPLDVAGIHAVMPEIDITNLVNLEFGQPTHLFDADKVIGKLCVRISEDGETALPLFADAPIVLPRGTLVIADSEKILAIAGIIGCQESKVTPQTRIAILESALFEPISIRKTSRKLNIRTDSATRFERGGDAEAIKQGAARAIWLLENLCNAKRVCPTYISPLSRDLTRSLHLNPDQARAFLQHDMSNDDICLRLKRYGFDIVRGFSADKSEVFEVIVPPFRFWDIEFASDLYEELAKSIGYSNVASVLPPVGMGSAPTAPELAKKRVDETMVGLGFYEVFTDGFYAHEIAHKMNIQKGRPLAEHVVVVNAVDKSYSLLRNNALMPMLKAVSDNLNLKVDNAKLFEWSRIFYKVNTAENGLCDEKTVLSAICCGHSHQIAWDGKPRLADSWFLKGVVEELSVSLGLAFSFCSNFYDDASHKIFAYFPIDLLHPTRRTLIYYEDKAIGVVGEIHPELCKRVGIKRVRPCYFEMSADVLSFPSQVVQFIDPPNQPPTVRNLAFTLPYGTEVAAVIDVIRNKSPEWLSNIRVVDSYEHIENGKPVRTITFDLAWSNMGKTKTTEELNMASDLLVSAVHAELGITGVKLRQ